MPFEEQTISIFSAINGFLDSVAVEDVQRYEGELIKFIKERHTATLDTIRSSGELATETEAALKAAVDDFTKNYFNK